MKEINYSATRHKQSMNSTAQPELLTDILNEARKRIEELANRARNKDYRFPVDESSFKHWLKEHPVAAIAIATGIIAIVAIVIITIIRKLRQE
jgi:hypothetical protein